MAHERHHPRQPAGKRSGNFHQLGWRVCTVPAHRTAGWRRMKILPISLLALLGTASGTGAFGQQVPAIQANASAAASASAGAPMLTGQPSPATNGNAPAPPPPGWPPNTVKIPLPSIKLDKKETAAANLSAKWRDKRDSPHLDADGVLRWMYGSSQTRIVCAPSHVCDIELKPGETVNNAKTGDKSFWSTECCTISGSPDGRVSHV